jgi:hypothetical protein
VKKQTKGCNKMNQIELLRHVANNLESGRAAGFGLQCEGDYSRAIVMTDMNLCDPESYTLAPRTHEVNNFTVPAPMSVDPIVGVVYYTAAPPSRDLTGSVLWSGSEYCLLMLTRRVLFATKAAAQQNALAMLGRDPALGVEGV